ncbi:MAG TPA: Crp/Fnr family transcriptional regulator [Saprospiraceae bacterium]|nr:Crp/Fnr family transcriptional regulator [Saprospiraceae bacterium]HNG89196.1 Crp/Fnr family transcriptional regulator [Saprospiraceae bacterium]
MDKSLLTDLISPLIAQVDSSMLAYASSIAESAQIRSYPAHTLIRPPEDGEGRQTICLLQGVMRAYYHTEEGTEVTVQLYAEGRVIPRTSGYRELFPEHIYHYETLSPVQVAVWEGAEVDHLAATIPNWYMFIIRLNNYLLVQYGRRCHEMLHDDATTRYRKFVERNPTLVQRVQWRHVASYLGVAPQSLSRIRQQFNEES